MTMEKYGVHLGNGDFMSKEDHDRLKDQAEKMLKEGNVRMPKCPKCSSLTEPIPGTLLPKCPNCGTAPFERDEKGHSMGYIVKK